MRPLEGTVVVADEVMARRPLCRLLATLGAEIRVDPIDAEHIGR